MRQGIIPSLSQIMGLELTDRFHVLAGGDDANLAGLSGAVQENDDE